MYVSGPQCGRVTVLDSNTTSLFNPMMLFNLDTDNDWCSHTDV